MGTFQVYLKAILLNQIQNVISIKNEVWYELTYRLS